jgi:hypothetical protein
VVKPRERPEPALLAKVRTAPLDEASRILSALSPRALLNLFVALVDVDLPRLHQLLARNDITFMLDENLRKKGERPPAWVFAETAESLARIAVAMVANVNRTGATYRHSYVTSRLAELIPAGRRIEFYEPLIELLYSAPYNSLVSRKSGLYYIYLDAAEAAFVARLPERAFQLCIEARGMVDILLDNEISAKARFAGSVKYASYLAHLDVDRFRDLEAAAHADLNDELRNVLRFDPQDGRLLRLRAALTRSNLWRSADAKHICGRLAAAEVRIELLEEALTSAYGIDCIDGFVDVSALETASAGAPLDERKAVGRVFVDIAQSYARLGDDARGAWYVAESKPYDLSPRSRLDADIALARVATDTGVIVRICEDFAREHVTGGLHSLSVHHRVRALNNYASISHRLANLLKANRDYSTSAFWRMQAENWRAEAAQPNGLWSGYAGPTEGGESFVELQAIKYAEHAHDVRRQMKSKISTEPGKAVHKERRRRRRARRADPKAREGVPGTPEFGEQAQVTEPPEATGEPDADTGFVASSLMRRLEEIADHLAHEDVNSMITILASVAQSPKLVIDEELEARIREVISAIADWRLARFDTSQSGGLGGELSHAQPVISAMRTAVALARVYAPYRLASVLLQLAQRPELHASERLVLIDEALVVARSQGRSVVEFRSFHRKLNALADLGSPVDDGEIAAQVDEIISRSNDSTAFLGVSGIFDRAFGMAAELAALAETLAECGKAQAAFRASALGQGWITGVLAQNPHAVTELNDTIRARASDDKLMFRKFYTTVLTRICASLDDSRETYDVGGYQQVAYDEPGTAIVRFVLPSAKRVWAVGRAADSTYFTVLLDATASDLSDLAEGVWFWLRTRTHPVERDEVLRRMYASCIEPLQPHLVGAERLTFAFHDRLPFLPLHGALTPSGFLGATVSVNYEISAGTVRPGDAVDEFVGAAIVGWDASTRSDEEARAVADIVGGAFTLIESEGPEAALKDVILNPKLDLKILHVAGHGHLLSYPDAMSSSVELAQGVSLGAIDMLQSGCYSRLVFLNVCGVGNHETTAGDLYGFALAARSRGAHAFLAPSTYVSPDDAKSFAVQFYRAALRHEASDAVRIATRELIDNGSEPAAWIPYALFGRLPPLS